MSGEKRRAVPRVREHVEKLREAGLDTQRFFDALVGIRNDSALQEKHRQALYKLIAMESFVWYLEALRNERIDRVKMREDAKQIVEANAAAVQKEAPKGTAAAPPSSDIKAGTPPTSEPPRPAGIRPKIPPPQVTKSERPPKGGS